MAFAPLASAAVGAGLLFGASKALSPKIPSTPAPASAADAEVQAEVDARKKRIAGQTGAAQQLTGGTNLAGTAETTAGLAKLLGQ